MSVMLAANVARLENELVDLLGPCFSSSSTEAPRRAGIPSAVAIVWLRLSCPPPLSRRIESGMVSVACNGDVDPRSEQRKPRERTAKSKEPRGRILGSIQLLRLSSPVGLFPL